MRVDTREVTVLVLDPAILDGELLAMALTVKGYPARAVRDEAAAFSELRRGGVQRVLIDGAQLAAQPDLPRRIQLRFPVEVLLLLADGGAVPAESLWGVDGMIAKCGSYPEVAERFDAHVDPPQPVVRVAETAAM